MALRRKNEELGFSEEGGLMQQKVGWKPWGPWVETGG